MIIFKGLRTIFYYLFVVIGYIGIAFFPFKINLDEASQRLKKGLKIKRIAQFLLLSSTILLVTKISTIVGIILLSLTVIVAIIVLNIIPINEYTNLSGIE